MRNRVSIVFIFALLAALLVTTGPPVAANSDSETSAPSTEGATFDVTSVAAGPVMQRLARVVVPAHGLKVTVTAPAGVRPKVRVRGPNGWVRTIAKTTSFRNAAPGYYRVKAASRAFTGGTAVPSVSKARVRVRRHHGALSLVKYGTVIAPETRVVPAARVNSVTDQPDGTQVLEVDGDPTAPVGAIVVAGVSPSTPTGLVSRVQSVDPGGSTTAYTVVPAKITDAFTDLSFDRNISIDFDGDAAVARTTAQRVLARGLSGTVTCSSGATFDVTRSLKGSISLALAAEYHAENPASSRLKATASANLDAALGAHLNAKGQCSTGKTQLGPTVNFTPITFNIGPVPVVIVPTLKFFGEASASLESAASIDVAASVSTSAWVQASVGGGVSHGFNPPAATITKNISYPPDVKGQLGGTLSARLTTDLYGLAGPHVEVNTGPHVIFAPTQVPWLDAQEVLSVDVGLNLGKCAQLWGQDLCLKFEAEVPGLVQKSWPLYRRNYFAAPSIATTEIPAAMRGQAYSFTLQTSDNRQGTWSIATGSLPAGLNMVGNKVQGTPTVAGKFPFTVRFTDGDGRRDNQDLLLTVLTPADAATLDAYRGKIARLADGTSFYIDKRLGKHPIPDGGTYECLTAQGVPVLDATASVTSTLPAYENAECVRANPGDIIRTDDRDAYLLNADWTRSWIPTGGDYMCLAANGHRVVDSVPRYYIEDHDKVADAKLNCYSAAAVNGKTVRASDGSSYYIDLRGGKHWIPDGGTFECVAAQRGTYTYTVPVAWLTQTQYENAQCVRANPGNVIRHSDGDAYLVNSNWTRSWIPDGVTYACYVSANGLVNNVPRYYIDDLTSAPNAEFPGHNCILRRTDGTAYFVNNSGQREWIPDSPTWDCEVGRGIKVLGPADSYTNSLSETGWHYCLNKANLRNKVLTHTDGDSSFIHPDDTRTWIPDEFTYNCRMRQGYPAVTTRWREYVNSFKNTGWDYCFDPATFRNRLIQHPDGDWHWVDAAGRRHYVPSAAAGCMQARYGTPAVVRWREYINNIPAGDWAVCGDTLRPNQNMDRGQWLSAGNGYTLQMQTDGNLVLYNGAGRALWASNTVGSGWKVRFDGNGALSVQDSAGNWLRSVCNSWNSGANRFVLQSDGNLVLYRDNTPLWDRSKAMC